MPGSKDILLYDRYQEFADKLIMEADVICCLDFNALKRIDEMSDIVAVSPGRKIMIDHHLYPEDFAESPFHILRFPLLPNWCFD